MNRWQAISKLYPQARSAFSTSAVRRDALPKIAEKQHFYLGEPGVPVHLKNTFSDKFSFLTVSVLAAVGVGYGAFHLVFSMSFPKKEDS